MMMEFYIEHNHHRLGPFDAISIIRKIRNRQIHPRTLIFVPGEDEGREAMEFAGFREVFEELNGRDEEGHSVRSVSLGFGSLVKRGVEFLSLNLASSIYTGVFLLGVLLALWLLVGILPSGVAVSIAASICGMFLFSLYQIAILRKTRMQLLTLHYLLSLVRGYGLRLLAIAVLLGGGVFAVPLALTQLGGTWGLALILFPGSLLLMLWFYAAILVADRGVGVRDALRNAPSMALSLGTDNFITLYLLLLINFICATLPVFLLISLPITISALCEVYDDHFNEFAVAD